MRLYFHVCFSTFGLSVLVIDTETHTVHVLSYDISIGTDFSFYVLYRFSILGIYPCKMVGYYNISKAALDMVTKQFALELGPHQIRVNSVNPTMVSTPNNVALPGYKELSEISEQLTPLKRMCTPEEIVKPIMYLLSDDASMVTSSIHVVDGGLFTRAPWIN